MLRATAPSSRRSSDAPPLMSSPARHTFCRRPSSAPPCSPGCPRSPWRPRCGRHSPHTSAPPASSGGRASSRRGLSAPAGRSRPAEESLPSWILPPTPGTLQSTASPAQSLRSRCPSKICRHPSARPEAASIFGMLLHGPPASSAISPRHPPSLWWPHHRMHWPRTMHRCNLQSRCRCHSNSGRHAPMRCGPPAPLRVRPAPSLLPPHRRGHLQEPRRPAGAGPTPSRRPPARRPAGRRRPSAGTSSKPSKPAAFPPPSRLT
mmetsp:Transcript_95770/g.310307  ORF Transcript_95770/g.310307 Transcript_95770/m.310307 type:complete len:262 (+) Transcript_95770:605-1390(+)